MPWDSSPFIIDAYHGTNAENLSSIATEGLRKSEGNGHYLGDGIYFFVAGTSANDPIADARDWAIAEYFAGTKTAARELAILKCEIKTSEASLLDLTTREGMEVYNYLRQQYLSKIRRAGYVLSGGPKYRDGQLINDALDNLIILARVVKGDFFFKFTEERKSGIDFRIPNTTILVVRPEEHLAEISDLAVHRKAYFQP